MKKRMALVACTGVHEGPWQRTRGYESGILIEGLGEGELILMDTVSGPDRQINLPVPFSSDGQFPFPPCDRFMFRKVKSSGSSTYVKVLLSEDANGDSE